MSRSIESNIKNYTMVEILKNILFFVPIMVLFLQENGLSMTQIMILQSIFAISVAILEIPTGYISDLFSRKASIILSGVFHSTGFIIYSLSSNFISFIIAEIFLALAVATISGSKSALIYDTLIDLKIKKDYKKVWGNIIFSGSVALMIANGLGGLIAKISLRHTFFFMIPFILAQIFFSLRLVEPKLHEKIKHHEALKEIKKIFFEKNKIKWLIIYSGMIYGVSQASLWLYAPYFKHVGLPLEYFGLIFAGFQIFAGTISKFAHNIENTLGKRNSLIIIAIIPSLSYFLMGRFPIFLGIAFGFLFQIIRGFLKIAISDYINELALPKLRATVLSMNSLFKTIVFASFFPFVGMIVDKTNIVYAMNSLSIIALITGIVSVSILKINKII